MYPLLVDLVEDNLTNIKLTLPSASVLWKLENLTTCNAFIYIDTNVLLQNTADHLYNFI